MSGNRCTATSLWSLGKSRTQHGAGTATVCQQRLACPGPGTRSGLAISSSLRRPSNTAGGRLSCSTGNATPSSYSTGITRTCPSSSGGFLLKRPCLDRWQLVVDYLTSAMAFAPREQFRVLYLDKRNNLIADEVLAE